MKNTLALILTTFVALGTLTGCAPTEPTPEFSGPWAAEFAEFYADSSDNEFVRSVLKKGSITEQDVAETWERFRTCLAGVGITISDIDAHGGYHSQADDSVSNTDEHQRLVNKCSKESGENTINALYYPMLFNPGHDTDDSTVVDCLIDAGVAPPNYTAEQYLLDHEADRFPKVDVPDRRRKWEDCESDPLGILR